MGLLRKLATLFDDGLDKPSAQDLRGQLENVEEAKFAHETAMEAMESAEEARKVLLKGLPASDDDFEQAVDDLREAVEALSDANESLRNLGRGSEAYDDTLESMESLLESAENALDDNDEDTDST